MKRVKILVFACGLLLPSLHLLQAQSLPVTRDNQTKFDNITVKEGLSSNNVLDIFQDRYGFIWFASMDGLNRFDGYEVVVFKNEAGNKRSLSGNLVTCITEDREGNLWVGTNFGLNKYDRKNNAFKQIRHVPGNANSLSNNHVRALYADTAGVLWVETVEGTLNKYDPATGKFVHYQHKSVYQPYYYYHTIYEDKEGTLWIGGRGIMPHRFDKENEEFIKFFPNPNDPTKKRDNDVSCYFEDSYGNFWVSALDGAFTFNKRDTFSKFLAISTNSIIEDNQRKLWFGTGSGLYKYDPAEAKMILFRHDLNNHHSIAGNHINKLFIDKTGNLWVATNDGVSKYSVYKNKFYHFFHVSGDPNTLSSNKVAAVIEDSNGFIWIGTEGGGLNRFDRQKGEFRFFKHHPDDPTSLRSDRVSCLYLDKAQDLWVGLWSGQGFSLYRPDRETFNNYVYNPNSSNFDWYNGFLEDSKGNFWIGLWGGNGIYQFDRKAGSYIKNDYMPRVIPPDVEIRDLAIFDEKNMWVAGNEGVFPYFDQGNFEYMYYWTLPEGTNLDYETGIKMNENNVRIRNFPPFKQTNAIVIDDDSNSWFGTDQGLYKFDRKKDSFSHFNKQNGLGDNNILELCKSRDADNIWIGTKNGLENFNIKTGKSAQVRSSGPELTEINKLCEDRKGKLWLGTSSGLFTYDPGTNKFNHINGLESKATVLAIHENENGLIYIATNAGLYVFKHSLRRFECKGLEKDIQLKSIHQDKNGKLWLGTNKGLFFVNTDQENPVLEAAVLAMAYPVVLEGVEIWTIKEDKWGYLWLGTNKGLYRYVPKSKHFMLIRPLEMKLCMRPVHLVSCMMEDKRGYIWLGSTQSGVSRLDPSTGLLKQFIYRPFDSSGFLDGAANCMLEDSKENIWIGGEGLNKFDYTSETFTHITKKDGLPHNTVMGIVEDDHGRLWISTLDGLCCFDPEKNSFKNYYESEGLQSDQYSKACTKLRSGELIFGGDYGFNIFNPDSIISNPFIPEIVLTDLEVSDKIRYRDLSQMKALELNYNESTITISFAALDFASPEDHRYKYMLEGYDDDWISCDAKSRKVKYTRIPHGKYVFRVTGTNNDGLWNETGTSLNIVVKPPFWETIWFYALEGLLAIALIFVWVHFRERKIKARQKNLELEQKLLRSQMNPHFIFNSLGAIQSYIFKKDPIEAGAFLSDFSELVRLILDNSRNEYVVLEKEVQTLKYYLRLQQLRFRSKFDYDVEVDEDIDTDYIMIPPMLAQPFIENSIEHGFREMKTKGLIKVRFLRKDDTILFETEDNGMGIEKALEQKTVGLKKKHESLATKITRERIENLNKGRKQKIKLEIKDLKHIDKSLSGTRVSFEIPFKTNASKKQV